MKLPSILLFVIQHFASQLYVNFHRILESFTLEKTFKNTALYKHELVTHELQR